MLVRYKDIRGGVPEWPKGSDCKSDGSAFEGSNPSPSTIFVFILSPTAVEGFPSGQRDQTVNLTAQPSKVRILLPPPFSCFYLLYHSALQNNGYLCPLHPI